MAMPFFTPGDDPGSNFPELLRRIGAGRRRGRTSAITVACPTPRRAWRMRFADGVVMAGDRRATSGNLISHRGMEKVVAGRPLQRRRHRRRRRPGDGDDQAVPAAARALREGRGLVAEPRGQGQPAVDDGARQPAGGDAGHGRRADLRRLRPAPAHRPAVHLRRHRRALRGAGLRRHRLGQPARRHRHQGRLPRRRCRRDDADRPGLQGPVGGRRRRLRHRRPRRAARHLPDRGHHHRRGLAAGQRRSTWRPCSRRSPTEVRAR